MKHIALDTETTGLDPASDRILELALREFDPVSGKLLSHLHWVINPQKDIPEEVSKVHGITNEMVKDKPLFKDIVKDLIDFCKGTKVVIHNAPFDTGMLNAEFLRLGLNPFTEVPAEIEDTLKKSRAIKNEKNTLDALCDKYEVDRSIRVTHGALTDCDLLATLYPKLMKDFKEKMSFFQSMLSFSLEESLLAEKSTDTLIAEVLELDYISNFLAMWRKQRTTLLKEKLENVDYTGPSGKVVFVPKVLTYWEKVRKTFLKNIDLSPYRKTTSAMYVKTLKAEESSDENNDTDEDDTRID